MTDKMPAWVGEAVEKGQDLKICLEIWRESQAIEREARAQDRELKKMENEKEIRLRELDLKERDIQLQHAKLDKHGSVEETANAGPVNNIPVKCKLPKFVEGQDIEVFLRSFERLVTVHCIDKSKWAIHLVPLLTGKALDAFSRITETESSDYDKIKQAILRRYELNADTYRQKFRSANQGASENFREFRVRLESYLQHWCEREEVNKIFDKLYDIILREQLMESCSRDLKLWLKEHAPVDVEQLVHIADTYQVARKTVSPQVSTTSNLSRPQKSSQLGGKFQDQRLNNQVNSQTRGTRLERKCFLCQRTGHMQYECPLRKNSSDLKKSSHFQSGQNQGKFKEGLGLCVDAVVAPGLGVLEGNEETYSTVPGLTIEEGLVNGKKASVLRDTGSTAVFVRSHLVSGYKEGGKRYITLADGSRKQCAEVVVDLETPYVSGKVVALVLDNPFADIIIGNRAQSVIPQSDDSEVCQVVETRAQKRQSQAQGKNTSKNKVTDTCNKDIQLDQAEHTENNDKNNPLNWSKEELIKAQQEDSSLEKVREFTKRKAIDSKSYFAMEKGMLYRIYTNNTGNKTQQIVAPTQIREKILSLAHDIPLAGHLGNKRTRQRIMQHFFWPGIFKDVSRYCRSCPQCQRSVSKGRVGKAPLISIPPMDEPFRRIAIDMVGPLPLTERKNRYILVACDYATKYPEATPLRTQDAETVAEALLEIFTRVGFPQEILSDRGTNFTSGMMTELCRLLKINKITTTPYHPQANGLVERFNGTLKSMLRCYAEQEPKNWDKYIPYVLFAYREIPQESTGFSPFELLYGRYVRGPLALLKEEWEEPESSPASVLSYIIETREKLNKMAKLAVDNEQAAKVNQKLYFDKKARNRHLEVGQKVLILLPTESSKLLAQWKGPFLVTEKVSPVDYKVKLKNGKEKTFHINMMKPWFDRDADAKEDILGCLDVINTLQCEDEIDDYDANMIDNTLITPTEGIKDVVLSPDLSQQQKGELIALCDKFSDVLMDTPGKTDIIQHSVHTQCDKPIYQKPYPLPYAMRDKVQKEIDDMLGAGLIEPSNSPWAAPICCVKKKDNSIRLCVDFRRLNEVTIFDPKPMPSVDDIFSKLGNARYVSKFDLTKGYWQVPLDPEAKKKSSFVTPMGQYQFTVMPFGMCNSPATFVRLMHTVLRGLEEFTDSYIDDILTFSNSWRDHLYHIEQVLLALRKSSLTAKPSKCQLGFESLEFVGHVVGNGHIRPTEDKVNLIKNWPRPQTKKQVRQFLGMIGFYRRYISNFASISAVLSDLTAKGLPSKVRWEERHQKAYDCLKDKLTKFPVLKSPNFGRPFILQTDASGRGVGAVLLQEFDDGRHPIMYLSKKLTPREDKFATVEKECYAIVWAVKKLHVYLDGVEFTVETDHRPLQWLRHMKNSNSRLLRWSLCLQEYQFNTRYIPGTENLMADILSRPEL